MLTIFIGILGDCVVIDNLTDMIDNMGINMTLYTYMYYYNEKECFVLLLQTLVDIFCVLVVL